MKKIGSSERYQNNNLKALIACSKFLGTPITLDQIKSKSQITSFLDTKIKAIEQDPDKKSITTWNDYLGRIKYFFRRLHNYDDIRFDDVQFSEWQTPDFVSIKKNKSKRISPYLENELWEKQEYSCELSLYGRNLFNRFIIFHVWTKSINNIIFTKMHVKQVTLSTN